MVLTIAILGWAVASFASGLVAAGTGALLALFGARILLDFPGRHLSGRCDGHHRERRRTGVPPRTRCSSCLPSSARRWRR
ncbi:MAG: hypothetical protein R2882_10235 [Gemmatimonadales bacterium]